jgi:hypothetical protein
MAALIHMVWRGKWDKVVTVFANTGEENEETLEFVRQCDGRFGFNTVWVEAVVHPGRTGTTHRVVDFTTASRKGEPYKDVIEKYGIPNQEWPHCTRELKTRPMYSYLDSLGWERGTYQTAIGIRADEARRRSKTAKKKGIIYPLMDMQPTTKPEVNEFWVNQPFRLNLMGYEGNCKWCWKKSSRKLFTIMSDHPERFDFPERMEEMYGQVGAEFGKPETTYTHRVFFRGELSTKALREVFAVNKDALERAENDAIILPSGRRLALDAEPGGCTETCEPDFEEELPA